MNKILVYFPYPLRDAKSGSAVRPRKMIAAFREYADINGFELIEIYGDSKERKRKIKEFKSKVNPKDVLMCYMENATIPLWLTDNDHIPRNPFLDLSFLKYLQKHKIPLGIFYRDAYWLFDDEYPVKGIKKAVMKTIFRIEKKVFEKYSERIYLPSIEMNRHLGFTSHKVAGLPPGSEKNFLYDTKLNNKSLLNMIYVGAISEKMGLSNLLNAIRLVNESEVSCKLLLVCREEDYNFYKQDIINLENLGLVEVRHAFGEELYSLYENMDIAIIPREKNVYNDFAVPVKLFEYLSFGLPVVATDNDAVANIINAGLYGLIVKSNPKDLSDGIIKMGNRELRVNIKENILKDVPKKHLWIHRAEKVVNELSKAKSAQ